jgi:hypothetical protein
MKVCDSCLEAAENEGAEDRETAVTLLVVAGLDLPDHDCDARENGGRCACTGHE